MNFQTLKGMIENLVKSHRCPMCQSGVTDSNIDVIGAAGTTINIDLECPKCQKHTMIRAEIAQFDASHLGINREGIENFKQYLENFKQTLGGNINIDLKTNFSEQSIQKNSTLIADAQIVDLSKTLKSKKISVSDLLGE